jgi:hypothetical protein
MNKENIIDRNGNVLFSAKKKEIEKKPSIGTILAIVGIDYSKNGENISNPLLWTTIEEKSKPVTDRIKGQISFPADTRKAGEDIMHNVIGSLVEFSDDERLIKNALFVVPSSFIERKVTVKDNPVDLVVVIFDGPLTSSITPLDFDEVSPNGWMSIGELKKEEPSHLRSFVREIISMEGKGNPISRAVVDYLRFKQSRISLSAILPADFSIADFYARREKLRDVTK